MIKHNIIQKNPSFLVNKIKNALFASPIRKKFPSHIFYD